jgi:hypothetical protein
MEELYQRTQQRLYDLRKNYHVVVKWQCELEQELRTDPARRELFDSISIVGPLDPRIDGLRGGRVEAFCYFFKCEPDWEIIHIDIVISSINVKCLYHIHLDQSLPLRNVTSIISCRLSGGVDARNNSAQCPYSVDTPLT